MIIIADSSELVSLAVCGSLSLLEPFFGEVYVVSPEKYIIYLNYKELILFSSDQIDQKCYNKHRFSGRFGEKNVLNSR